MGSVSKRKIPISNKDLKKSILSANKYFETKNKRLESTIKDKEKIMKRAIYTGSKVGIRRRNGGGY